MPNKPAPAKLLRRRMRGRPGTPRHHPGQNQNAKEFGVKRVSRFGWQRKMPAARYGTGRLRALSGICKRVREIYLEYTDRVEPFGLDEAWLDVTGSARLFGSGKAIAEEIRRRVREEIGITVSIGVSFNKIFAKLGSDYQKPDAVTVISRDNFREIVWPLPSGELLYVGPATKRSSPQWGFTQLEMLRAAGRSCCAAISEMGRLALHLCKRAGRLPRRPLQRNTAAQIDWQLRDRPARPENARRREDYFSVLCDSVCRRMREQGLRCKTVSIHIRDNELHTLARQCRLDRDSSITKDITDASMRLFKSITTKASHTEPWGKRF